MNKVSFSTAESQTSTDIYSDKKYIQIFIILLKISIVIIAFATGYMLNKNRHRLISFILGIFILYSQNNINNKKNQFLLTGIRSYLFGIFIKLFIF